MNISFWSPNVTVDIKKLKPPPPAICEFWFFTLWVVFFPTSNSRSIKSFSLQMQLLNSNGFRWHSIAHLSVCAIEKASTGLPDTTKWFRTHKHTHSQCPMLFPICVCVCSRGIWSEFVICDIFPVVAKAKEILLFHWWATRNSRFQALLITYFQYWRCWFHSTLNSDSEYESWYHSNIHWQWILTHLSNYCLGAGQTVT